jgi:hypothetical protein
MSPSLYFNNKKYLSAKEASAITGYSRDYIGQLARGSKIGSKRIGRIWYVEEESLLKYKNLSLELTTLSSPGINVDERVESVRVLRPEESAKIEPEKILPYSSENPLAYSFQKYDLSEKLHAAEILYKNKKRNRLSKKSLSYILASVALVAVVATGTIDLSSLAKNTSRLAGNFLGASATSPTDPLSGTSGSLITAFKNYVSPDTDVSGSVSGALSLWKSYLTPKPVSQGIATLSPRTITAPKITNTALLSALRTLLANDLPEDLKLKLRGPQGPRGLQGDSGQQVISTQPSSTPPIPSIFLAGGSVPSQNNNNFSGSTLFGATDLSSNNFNTNNATITSLEVTGSSRLTSLSISGSTGITGNLAVGGTLSSTGSSTLATGSDTTNTFGSGASSINTIGSDTTPGALTLHGSTTLDNNFTQTGASTFSTGTGAISLNGNASVTGANTFSTGTGTVTLNNVATNLTATDPVIDLTSASTLSINTVTNRPITFGTGLSTFTGNVNITSGNLNLNNGGGAFLENEAGDININTANNFPVTFGTGTVTIPNLVVTNSQGNNGTMQIDSAATTQTVFTVNGPSLTSGTGIAENITANAGNGQTTHGHVLNLTDSTTAGGGFQGLGVTVTGTGNGSGAKYLLDLNPNTANNEIVFDNMGAFRPTTSVASNTNTIGSPSFYWKNGYFDQITANNIAGTVITGATSSTTWTIGSTEAGDVNESIIFQRNSGSGNALIQWNAGAGDLRYLSANYPFNATYTVSDSSIGTGINLLSANLTNNTTGGTQKLLSLTNTGTGTTENGIYINNTGTGTTAFEIAGTWTNGIITNNNSVNAGTGALTAGATTLSGTLNLNNTGVGVIQFGANTVFESDGASVYFSPQNDTTGSIYSYTGGVARLQIDNTGNLNIGTSGSGTVTTIQGKTSDSTSNALVVKNAAGNPILYGRNDGFVGIGTNSPAAHLQIVGAGVEADQSLSLGDSRNNAFATVFGARAGAGLGTASLLIFKTDQGAGLVEAWRINNSGHFLAGTDNTYDIGASGATRPRTGYFGTSVVTPSLTASTSLLSPLLIGSTSANGTLTLEGNNTTGNTSTNANLIFKTGDSAGTTAMTILNNGNIGIGTTNPAVALEVNGEIQAPDNGTIRFGAAASNQAKIVDAGNQGLQLWATGNTNATPEVDITGNTTMTFRSNTGNGSSAIGFLFDTRTDVNIAGGKLFELRNATVPKFTVTGSGNVGIGTTGPLSLLHIKGSDTTSQQLTYQSSDANWKGRLGINVAGSTISTLLSTGGTWSLSGTTYTVTKDFASFPSMGLVLANQYNNVTNTHFAIAHKAGGASTSDGSITDLFTIDGLSPASNNGTTYNIAEIPAVTTIPTGAATTPTAYNAFKINAPVISQTGAAGAYTNASSLYITGAPTASSAGGFTPTFGHTYAIYSAAGDNYFGGNIGIGSTNPTNNLSIGSVSVGTFAGVGIGASANMDIRVGQDTTHSVILGWKYNATAGSAYSVLENYAGNNPLALQTNGGNVGIGTTNPTSLFTVGSDKFQVNSSGDLSLIGAGFGGTTMRALNMSGTVTGGVSEAGIWMGNLTGDSSATTQLTNAFMGLTGGNSGSPYTTADAGNIFLGGITAGTNQTITRAWGLAINDLTSGTNNVDLFIGGGPNLGTTFTGNYAIYNNTSKQTYLGTGNVGIGTTNPSRALEVGGGGLSPAAIIRLNDSNDAQAIFFAQSNTDRFKIVQAGAGLQFLSQSAGAGGVGRFFNFSGGTLGNGDGPSGNNGLFSIGGTFSDVSNKYYGLVVNITNTNSAANSSIADFRVGGTSKVFFDVNGNVGIGTTNPGVKLDVVGVENITSNITYSAVTGVGQLVLRDASTTTKGLYLGVDGTSNFGFVDAGNNGVAPLPLVINGSGGDVYFSKSAPASVQTKVGVYYDAQAGSSLQGQFSVNGATDTHKTTTLGYDTTGNYGYLYSGIRGTSWSNLSLEPLGGNVGIGTTNPAQKLEVNGHILGDSNFGSGGVAANTRFLISGNGQAVTNQYGFYDNGTFALSGAATEAMSFRALHTVNTASGNLTNDYGMKIGASTNAGGGTVTNAYGIYVDAPTIGSTVNTAGYFGGNVGIGSTNPGYKLEVSNGIIAATSGANTGGFKTTQGSLWAADVFTSYSGSTQDFVMTDYNNSNFFSIRTMPTNYDLSISTALNNGRTATIQASNINLQSADTPYDSILYAKSNGRVGIGTTSPYSTLDIVSANADNITQGLTIGGSSGIGGHIYFDTSGTTNTIISSGYDNVASKMTFRMRDLGTDVNAMTILGSGNVGIGTTAPGAKLDVAVASGGNGLNITNTSVSKSWQLYPVTNGAQTDIRLFQGGVGDQVTFQAGGNVGIGTTNPSAKLDVAGEIHSTGAAGAVYLDSRDGSGTNFGWYNPTGDDLRLYAGGDKLTVLASGNVGIGTTNPGTILDLYRATSDSSGLLRIINGHATNNAGAIQMGNADGNIFIGKERSTAGALLTGSTAYAGVITTDSADPLQLGAGDHLAMTILPTSGNIGIGTANPAGKLEVSSGTGNLDGVFSQITDGAVGGGAAFNAKIVSTAQYLAYFSYSSTNVGSITTNGTITGYNTTSDERLKENIQDTHFNLNDLMNIQVKDYSFISDQSHTMQNGFIAQQLYTIYPGAVHVGGDDASKNPWSVDYGKLTPLLVKGVQEMNLNLESIAGTNTISTLESESFMNSFFDNLFGKTKTWLADAGNGITDIFANTFHAKDKICINETCINEAQLQALIAGNGSGGNGGGSAPSGGEEAPADTTPPVITLTGEATINLNLGDAYTEEGATGVDETDGNVAVIVSGSVDANADGTYVITYNAHDTVGNNATEVTRTVIVGTGTTPPPEPPAEEPQP